MDTMATCHTPKSARISKEGSQEKTLGLHVLSLDMKTKQTFLQETLFYSVTVTSSSKRNLKIIY